MNLFGEHFTQRATKHGEVLAEHENFASVNRAPAGDNAVRIWVFFQTSSMGTMSRQQIKFVKASFVEQRIYSLARKQLSFFVLAFNRSC